MIEVVVKRGLGDRACPDEITSPLITTVPVALFRGESEINNSSPASRKKLTVQVVPMPFVLAGAMVRIQTYKGTRVGMLTSFEKEYLLDASSFVASCSLGVEVLDG